MVEKSSSDLSPIEMVQYFICVSQVLCYHELSIFPLFNFRKMGEVAEMDPNYRVNCGRENSLLIFIIGRCSMVFIFLEELASYSLLRMFAFQLNRASKCNQYIRDTRFGNILSTRMAKSRIKMYLIRKGNEFIVARLRARIRYF